MDPELHKLIEHYKREQCPSQIKDRVRAMVGSNRPKVRPYIEWGILGSMAATLLFVLGYPLWLARVTPTILPNPGKAVVSNINHEETIREAALSLAYIGSILVETSQTVEKEVLGQSQSPMKDRYLKMKTYLTNTQ